MAKDIATDKGDKVSVGGTSSVFREPSQSGLDPVTELLATLTGSSTANAATTPFYQAPEINTTHKDDTNNHRHSEQNENTHNQAEKDRSGSVKGEKQAEELQINEKPTQQTDRWAFVGNVGSAENKQSPQANEPKSVADNEQSDTQKSEQEAEQRKAEEEQQRLQKEKKEKLDENQEDKANTIKGFSKRPAYCGDTTRKFEMADGSVQIRTGGTVAWRNNNVGNMKIEYENSCDKTVKTKRTYEKALQDARKRYDGVVDLDQFGNIVFETPEAGAMAKAKLVLKGHKNETIPQMLRGYAKSDYTGKVNYESYQSTIYNTGDSMGVNLRINKKISELSDKEKDALLAGMTKHEGVKKGKIEVIPAKKK